MTKTLLKFATSAALVSTACANPVDFTTGFTTDSPLNGQNNWAASGGFTINANGASDDGFDRAILTNVSDVVSFGDKITATIQFRYSVLVDTPSGSPLLNVSFFDSNDPASSTGSDPAIHNRLCASATRSDDGLRIRMRQNWGGVSPAENGVDDAFGQSDVGSNTGIDFDGADAESVDGDEDLDSDLLELTLTLTAGLDEDDWVAEAVIRNVDTDTEVISHTRSNLSFAAYNSSVYAGIGTGQGDGVVQVSERSISRFEYTYMPLPNQATVGFTALEGYADGDLNSNPDWSSQGDTVSDTAGAGIVTLDGFDEHIFLPLPGIYEDGATYEASIDFSFTDNATYTPPATPTDPITDVAPGGKPLVNVGIFNQTDPGAIAAGVGITDADVFDNLVLVVTDADHNYTVGQTVRIDGLDFVTTDPNGTFEVTTVSASDTFEYALVGPDEVFGGPSDNNARTYLDEQATPQLRAGISRAGSGYIIHFQTGWNRFRDTFNPLPYIGGVEQSFGTLSTPTVDGLDVGIDRTTDMVETADLNSDQLRLTITLTAGADNATWDALCELFNLDSGTPNTPLLTKSLNGITSFTANQLYAGFGSGQGDGNALIANRNVDDFSYSVTYPTTGALGDIEITSVSFDGTTVTIGFTGDASTAYILTSSPDIETMFADTGESTSTDESGIGTFSYVIPGPPTESFFQVATSN